MSRRSQPQSSSSSESPNQPEGQRPGREFNVRPDVRPKAPQRSRFVFQALFALIVYSSWTVYYYQYQNLPSPLTSEQAGKRGFSEIQALKHVEALTQLGPHSVGSDALVLALQVWLLLDFLFWGVFIFRIFVQKFIQKFNFL